MADNGDFEIYKYMLGVIGGFLSFLGGLNIKFLSDLKGTDEKIMERINGIDKRTTVLETQCEERRNREK